MRWRSGMMGLTLFGAAIAHAAPPGDEPGAGPAAPARTLPAGKADEPERWPMSLPEAIRIALDNSEIIRVVHTPIAPGTIAGPTLIERVKVDTPPARFRSDATALVRSVEQQYWVVAAQRARAACAETAVRTAREVLDKEQAPLYCKSPKVQELAEAIPTFEHLKNDLTFQADRLADAERRLGLIIGVPPAIGRRIVTTTRPIDRPVASDPRRADSRVDADYRRYEQARQHRIDADGQFEARKVDYEKGRITIDRYFEAIVEHSEAMAAEADAASLYNTSIAAVGEARGTLLAERFILVVDRPSRIPRNRATGPDNSDKAVKKASLEIW